MSKYYVDAEYLIKYVGKNVPYISSIVAPLIFTTPSIQLIRCKECKYYGVDKMKGGFCMRTKSPAMWNNDTGELRADDFCSYAETRCKQ